MKAKLYLTLLLVLSVLSSAAQDGEKKTFKALGTDWRVFGVTAKLGPAVSKEDYKLNYSKLNSVISSQSYDMINLNKYQDSGFVYNEDAINGGMWSINFTIKPLVLSNRKLLSRQEFYIGVSQITQFTSKDYQWHTDINSTRFRLSEGHISQFYRTTYIEPKWIIRTRNIGELHLVLYTGLGARIGIGGESEIYDRLDYADFDENTSGGYEQITSTTTVRTYHNLKPNNTYMLYMPFGLKKYLSCRFNFVVEGFYGRGVTKIKDGGNWGFSNSGIQFGLQYKFQKPVKLDNEDKSEDRRGVFW